MLSVTDSDSEIHKINQSSTFEPSSETASIIKKGLEVSKITDGAFDVTVYPIVEAWGFTKSENAVPSQNELENAKQLCGYEKVIFDGDVIKFDGKIDLGGIAKGYVCDKAKEILRTNGIEKAIVSSGSSILLHGKDWRVGIQHPQKSDELICTLKASDTCVVSSGGYQRFFEQGGKKYHHIIDPDTAYPADNGILSSTVICEDGTLADALSTALYVMGVEKAISLYRENKTFDMVLVTEDSVYSTLEIEVADKSYSLNMVE